ncbi:DNA alkylation repair protein [Sunxiuqinia sp. A32]|uniref:DNA alkylation repair protein n=1 Tax=Sunxiuqinia sp. A32 TaxID=3461496 RepID=UPI004045E137
MTHDEIINKMIEDLESTATHERKALGVINFPTSMEMLGVRAADLKAVAKNWRGILYDFSLKDWIDLCVKLVNKGIFECQQLAYELVWKNKPLLKSLSKQQVLDLAGKLDNWASVDSYCTMIAGWHWREGTLQDAQILKWLESENRWWRRVAVVCTIPLNLRAKGGTGDVERTLMVCEKVIDDRDDMVIKALSWALRELSKSDKQAVIDFMDKYWDQLHGRVRREVTTKLETGRKNG